MECGGPRYRTLSAQQGRIWQLTSRKTVPSLGMIRPSTRGSPVWCTVSLVVVCSCDALVVAAQGAARGHAPFRVRTTHRSFTSATAASSVQATTRLALPQVGLPNREAFVPPSAGDYFYDASAPVSDLPQPTEDDPEALRTIRLRTEPQEEHNPEIYENIHSCRLSVDRELGAIKVGRVFPYCYPHLSVFHCYSDVCDRSGQ